MAFGCAPVVPATLSPPPESAPVQIVPATLLPPPESAVEGESEPPSMPTPEGLQQERSVQSLYLEAEQVVTDYIRSEGLPPAFEHQVIIQELSGQPASTLGLKLAEVRFQYNLWELGDITTAEAIVRMGKDVAELKALVEKRTEGPTPGPQVIQVERLEVVPYGSTPGPTGTPVSSVLESGAIREDYVREVTATPTLGQMGPCDGDSKILQTVYPTPGGEPLEQVMVCRGGAWQEE